MRGSKHLWLCRERWAWWKKNTNTHSHTFAFAMRQDLLENAARGYYILAHTFPHKKPRAEQAAHLESRMVYACGVMQFTACAFYMQRARAQLYILCHYTALRDSTSSLGSRVDIYTDTTTQWKIECHAASSLPQMMECLKARYRAFIHGARVPARKREVSEPRVDWLNCSAWLNFSWNVNRRENNITIERQVRLLNLKSPTITNCAKKPICITFTRACIKNR